MEKWHPDMPQEYKNQIVTGDARELAKRIPDESVDLIFTSPPYNKGVDYGVWDDNMDEGDFWAFQRGWLGESFRIASPGSRMYVIVSDEMIEPIKDRARLAGWNYHQMLSWCKPNMAFPYGNRKWDWSMMSEYGLLFHKGEVPSMRNTVTGINTHNWIVAASAQSQFNGLKKKVFAAQMSYEVAMAWIGRTPGDVLYEPFAGSGTSLIVAKMLGRNYIAFEIDPDTADLARKRVREAQPALFVSQPEQLDLMEQRPPQPPG